MPALAYLWSPCPGRRGTGWHCCSDGAPLELTSPGRVRAVLIINKGLRAAPCALHGVNYSDS
jgi:hypothetical protein